MAQEGSLVVFVLFSSSMFNHVVFFSDFLLLLASVLFCCIFLLSISAQLLGFVVPSYLLVLCLQGLATKVLFCLV